MVCLLLLQVACIISSTINYDLRMYYSRSFLSFWLQVKLKHNEAVVFFKRILTSFFSLILITNYYAQRAHPQNIDNFSIYNLMELLFKEVLPILWRSILISYPDLLILPWMWFDPLILVSETLILEHQTNIEAPRLKFSCFLWKSLLCFMTLASRCNLSFEVFWRESPQIQNDY